MKAQIVLFVGLLGFVTLSAQTRYKTEIFSSTSKVTVNYSDVYTGIDHEMDIYSPDGDTAQQRPVIFFLHGGAFYAGDKGSIDCKDFCESFAKRGYVAVSANYRLTTAAKFLSSHVEQYKAVLKGIADVKSAIRYMRKSFENGNTYGIDTANIFVGGYSAGAVLAMHLAFVDSISDLPTTPVNVQSLVDSIGGSLDGDAGNNGYSSKVNGVFSYSGGMFDVDLIDTKDEPLVAVHGTVDGTVGFDCAPALGNPLVLTLCGMNVFIPFADSVGIVNDSMVLQGVGHGWAAQGNSGPEFNPALDFTADFFYKLLPAGYTSVQGHMKDVTLAAFYPNPVSNQLHINTTKVVEIKVLNQLGMVLLNKTFDGNHTVDLSSMSPGIYEVFISDGSAIQRERLVKR